MKVTLQNGHEVCASLNHNGDVESVSMALDDFNSTGFIVVSFLDNGWAREICASTSDGFVSIRNFQNNTLINETFRDVLHQKTFYYTYDEAGHVLTAQLDSQNKDWAKKISKPRETLMHAPFRLYEELEPSAQLLMRAQKMPQLLARTQSTREKEIA
ncbi:MAG: hypothetical protein ACI4QM_03280 [Alphaproteobacteria bacterium]